MTPWPSALLFDLDGTLADSFAAIGLALNRALAELALPARDLAWTRAHVGRGAVELVRDAVAPAGEDAMRTAGAAFARHYEAIYREQTPPLPGADEVLELAAACTGGRVAIVSNKQARFSRGWLEHWGLGRHVAIVAGPDSYGARKPDAAAVLPVLEELGVAAGEALLVGDMEVDAITGRNAAVPVVLVRGGATAAVALDALGALAVLDSVADLPAWLVSNGRGWR